MSCTLTRTYEFVDNRHTQDPEQLLNDFADTLSRTGSLIFRGQSAGVVFCPEHAQMLADAGMSKADVKDWFIEHVGRTEADLRRAGKDGVSESGPGARSASETERAPADTFTPYFSGAQGRADHRGRRAQRGDLDGLPRVRRVVEHIGGDRVRRPWPPRREADRCSASRD